GGHGCGGKWWEARGGSEEEKAITRPIRSILAVQADVGAQEEEAMVEEDLGGVSGGDLGEGEVGREEAKTVEVARGGGALIAVNVKKSQEGCPDEGGREERRGEEGGGGGGEGRRSRVAEGRAVVEMEVGEMVEVEEAGRAGRGNERRGLGGGEGHFHHPVRPQLSN
ncbi:hypothetical protein CYMTET_35847, partial [Cymbomonas tetramitiformis]